MAPDVENEMEILAGIEDEDLPPFNPLFDPIEFDRQHKTPKLTDFRLSDEDLRLYAL